MKMRNESNIECTLNRIMLVIFAFILIFTPFTYGTVNTIHIYIFHLIVVLLVVLWGVKMVVVRNVKLLKTPLYIPILCFIGYILVHVYQSDILYYARIELIKAIDYGLLFIIFVNNFYRKRYIYSVLFIFLFIGILLSSMGIIQYFKKTNVVYGLGITEKLVDIDREGTLAKTYVGLTVRDKPDQYANRASGSFICPNHLAGYIELILPFALGICLFSRFVMGVRFFIGYGFIVLLAGWILTFSRGGWLAGIASFLSFIIFALLREDHRGNNWVLPIIIIGIFLGMLTVFVKPIQERVLSITPNNASAATRLKIWGGTLVLIKEKPILGHGPGSFRWQYPRVRYKQLARKVTYSHNDYLNALNDLGAIGLTIVLSFFLLLLFKVRKIPELYEMRDYQLMLVAGLSSVVAVMVHSIFDFNNQIYSNAVLFIVIAGIVDVSSHNFESDIDQFIRFKEINKKLFLRILLVVIFFTGGIIAFIQGGKLLLSEINFQKGELLQKNIFWDKAEKRYLAAAKFDPINPEIYAKLATIQSSKHVFRKAGNSDAIKLYDIALRYNPYAGNYLLQKAILLKRDKRFEEAKSTLITALKLAPHHYIFNSELKRIQTLLSKQQ